METDKELFEGALEDQVVEQAAADETVVETATETEQPRDDHGRFASAKAEEPAPEVKPAAEAPKDEAFVPSWRLREIREEREAVERRFNESQAQWQRRYAELEARLPKAEPAPAPDVFENPNAFLDHGVRQAVDPIKSEVQQTREFFSQMMAEQKYGADKVKAARDWLASGLSNGDPEVAATYQRAMRSMHPYGDIVESHQKQSVFQQIGNDPNAWFEKQLEERMKDPTFQASILGKTQQTIRANPSTPNTIQRPPSLNRIAAAAGNDDADNDMSDAGLFAHALR